MVKSVILAAGKGTRMKSDKPKVVHQVMGKPMVYYSIEAARSAGADKVCVIVGYKADEVKKAVEESEAEELAAAIEEDHPDCDVEVNAGGQPIYYYVISVE